jgi:ATP-dependent DNA ligase
MDLPVQPPVAPMLAKAAKELPVGENFAYEPKWDGFRCIVFRSGDEVHLGSRNERPLTRYFPELVGPICAQLPDRVVLDGEIVIATPHGLDFDALQLRMHPAESRVKKLAAEIPASFVAFDLLALGDVDARPLPLSDRWRILQDVMGEVEPPLYLTPSTRDPAVARDWFERFEGAGLDGVVAKRLDGPYVPNGRTMLKIKHSRTADVVVAGYRLHKTSTEARPLLGSMLLGLYAEDGRLQHVGVCASFTEARRAELVQELDPLRVDFADHPWGAWQDEAAQASGRLPGGQSRWTGTKDLSFVPLAPTRVAEVGYEHMEGDRFRHTAQFKRWREDREPESCGYAPLEEVARYDLKDVLL